MRTTPYEDTVGADERGVESYALAALIAGLIVLIVSILLLLWKPALGAAPAVGGRAPVRSQTNFVSEVYSGLSRCQPGMAEPERWRIAGAIDQESRRYGYDPMLVLAMIEVESSCRPTARGPRGAIGLTQVKPSTARIVAGRIGLRWQGKRMLEQPAVNVRLGLRYLWELERRFGDPVVALAAYNLGPTRVARMPRRTAHGAQYVRKILARYEGHLADNAVRPS